MPREAGQGGSGDALIERTSLLARVEGGSRLTVLRGPRGAGKRVLVDQWAAASRSRGRQVIRVEVDPRHAEAADVWAEVLSRLDVEHDRGRSAARQALDIFSGQAAPSVLVVERAELLADDTLDRDLMALLRQSPTTRVLVSTELLRPVEVLGRVEHAATVLTAPDLALATEEVLALLGGSADGQVAARAALGELGVDPVEAAAHAAGLAEAEEIRRTYDGWAGPTAALARDPEGTAARDFVRYVLGMLEPAPLRRLAAQLALLPRLPRGIVEALAADADLDQGIDVVGQLVDSGLCVAIGSDADSPLAQAPGIRDALQGARGDAVLGAEEAALLRWAARWYLEQGMPDAAAEAAWLAEDHTTMVEVLDQHWPSLAVHHGDRLGAWIGAVPEDLLLESPSIALVRTLLVEFPSDAVGAEAFAGTLRAGLVDRPVQDALTEGVTLLVALRSARQPLLAVPVVDQQRALARDESEGWVALAPDLRSLLYVQWGLVSLLAGDLAQAVRDFQEGYWTGRSTDTSYVARNGATNAALVHALHGDRARARRWLDRASALPRAEGFLRQFVEEWDPLVEALLASEAGELAEADAALARFTSLEGAHPGWIVEAYVRAHLAVCGSRPREAAAELASHAMAEPETVQVGSLAHGLLTSVAVDLDLRLGRSAHARELLEGAGEGHLLQAARARLALALGDPETAKVEAAAGLVSPEAHGFRRVDLLVALAVAERRLDPTAGGDHFADAVGRARRDECWRGIATGPRADVLALARAARDVLLPDWVLRAPDAVPDLAVVQLSERERLVLIELARTASHQEIARTLVVSINTVKTQVRSIYRKFGTRTRSETLAAALAHGFSLSSDAS